MLDDPLFIYVIKIVLDCCADIVYRGNRTISLASVVNCSTPICTENNLREFTKSLMKILKNNGPKIEPCGIPVLSSNNLEVIFSDCTYWKRLIR